MNTFKRLLSVILTLSLLCGACVVSTGAAYTDVPAGAWYEEAVNWCGDNGIMSGTSDTAFFPDSTMSRAMLATVLYRIAGSPATGETGAFSDVTSGSWYADAVVWASETGVMSGYGGGVFGSNDPVTREQLAAILYRYAQSINQGVSVGEDTNILSYDDAFDIAEYAIPAMQWAVGAGIISGNGAALSPKGSATRAQVASILYRWLSAQDETEPAPAPGDEQITGSPRILVAYFSRAGENYSVGVISKGNTAIVAELIAEQIDGDLFEIVPVTPYPSDYEEMKIVSTRESDSNARPDIANTVENWDDYDIVFLGYPIWYGDMPMIVYNFLESYDFSGKTVIPFNTHEGSGQSGTQSRIESAIPTARVLNGIAIRGAVAQNNTDSARSTVESWITEDLKDVLP